MRLTNSHKLQRPQSDDKSDLCKALVACLEAPLPPVSPTRPLPRPTEALRDPPSPRPPRKMATSKQPLLHKLPPATSPSRLTPPLPRAKCPDPSQASPPPHPHLRKTPGSPGPVWRWQTHSPGKNEGLRQASREGPGRPHFLQGQSLHTSPQAALLLSPEASLTLSEAKHTHEVTDSRSHLQGFCSWNTLK